MMSEPVQGINHGSIDAAFETEANKLEVIGVHSIWSPVVATDEQLAEATALRLINHIVEDYPELDDVSREVLVKFGKAVGTLSMRLMFQPFLSDRIHVSYRRGSGLDQSDAIRRVKGGEDSYSAVEFIL